MQIAIFGLGYVGVVSAACLARDGHSVLGVDVNAEKVALINQGSSPIVEPGLGDLISDAVRHGRLRATTDSVEAVRHAGLILVCVGTPGHANGSLDLSYVRRVCEQIGHALAATPGDRLVVIRSTMLPGSMRSIVLPALEHAAQRSVGDGFRLCVHPEFLREGTAIFDYDHPPKTVIGTREGQDVDALTSLYSHLDAPLILTDYETAEMVKYADNAWHALKVTFANEMGRICKALDVDSRTLMEHFCEDRKLNISRAYLRPGFAFGGSCLPKDVRALTYQGRSLDVDTPVLSAILASNNLHVAHALSLIYATSRRRIGLLGLSFKEGTDDLRESPIVTIAETLLGKGYELRIYDRNVRLASLFGANRDYIMNRIPHISRLLVDDARTLADDSDVIVVGTTEPEFETIVDGCGSDKIVIDLVGVHGDAARRRAARPSGYQGIAW